MKLGVPFLLPSLRADMLRGSLVALCLSTVFLPSMASAQAVDLTDPREIDEEDEHALPSPAALGQDDAIVAASPHNQAPLPPVSEAASEAEVRVVPPSGVETDPSADPAMLKALRQSFQPATARIDEPAAQDRISSGTLPTMTADSIGLSPADAGQEPVDAHFALQQVMVLPVALPSTVLRTQSAHYLTAEWPLKDPVPGAEIVPGALLNTRITQLISWGYLAETEQLLAQIPPSMQSDDIAWASMLLAFVKTDTASACALAGTGVTAHTTGRWQYAMIYCHALMGRTAEAQLGLDMLAEQSQQADPLFREVITALNQKKPMKRAAIPANPGLWEQLMLVQVAAKQPLLELMPTLATPLLAQLSNDAKADAALRKSASAELAKRTAPVAPGEWLTPARISYPVDASALVQHEAKRTYALLQALHIPLDATAQQQWSEQLARPAAQLATTIPAAPNALAYLDIALRKGDKRSVIFAAVNLLPASLAQMEDATVLKIVAALQQIGLEAEARQFAAESIAAIGAEVRAEKAASKKAQKADVPLDNLSRPAPGAVGVKVAPQPRG